MLAGIYLGKITKWNDPQIVKDNAKPNLSDKPIVVVHRSDSSRTSYIFTDYLSKIGPEWEAQLGESPSINWPVGLGAEGNEGIAGIVR